MCKLGGTIVLLGIQWGCVQAPELPPVAKDPYSVTRIALPDCAIQAPPVRDDFDFCPIEAIGTTIRFDDVCQLLAGLKDWMSNAPLGEPWMHPGDFSKIRAISVCHLPEPRRPEEDPNAPFTRWFLRIEAYVPERPRDFFVTRSDNTRAVQFGLTHRNPV